MLGLHPARGALKAAGLGQAAAVLGDGEQGSQGPKKGGMVGGGLVEGWVNDG